jgi:hypothetical protein
MAVVLLQPQIGLTLVDASSSKGQFGTWVRASTSAAQGRAAVATLRSLLPSSCVAITARVTYTVDEQAPAPGAGDATRTGVFVFSTTEPNQFAVVAIPGLRGELVDPAATHLVDLTAAPVQALISALETGIWCNPFGYSLTTCIAALVELRNP